jgi:hypothetical protein
LVNSDALSESILAAAASTPVINKLAQALAKSNGSRLTRTSLFNRTENLDDSFGSSLDQSDHEKSGEIETGNEGTAQEGITSIIEEIKPFIDIEKLRMQLLTFTHMGKSTPVLAMPETKQKFTDFWLIKHGGLKTPLGEMSKVAKEIIAIPCSSIGVERNFRHFSLVLTELRHKLSADTLNSLLLAKLNFEWIKDKKPDYYGFLKKTLDKKDEVDDDNVEED